MGQTYDVLQIGYGPVSEGLALMLARKGHRVAVCERWETRYPMPRAVCIDHELYRVLSANGMGAVLPTVSQRGPLYQWFNAEWKELLVRQDNNTANMIHPIDAQIAYLSTAFTLEPGDLIATGTPEGVGIGMEPQRFLQPGDIVRCEVEGIGAIENRVVA